MILSVSPTLCSDAVVFFIMGYFYTLKQIIILCILYCSGRVTLLGALLFIQSFICKPSFTILGMKLNFDPFCIDPHYSTNVLSQIPSSVARLSVG